MLGNKPYKALLVIKKDRENINGNLNLSEMEESIFRQRFNNEKFKLWQQPSRTKNVSIDIHSPFLNISIYNIFFNRK